MRPDSVVSTVEGNEDTFRYTSARSTLAMPSLHQKRSATAPKHVSDSSMVPVQIPVPPSLTGERALSPIPLPASLRHKQRKSSSNSSATSVVRVPKRKHSPDIIEELFGEDSNVTHESSTVNIDDLLFCLEAPPQTDSLHTFTNHSASTIDMIPALSSLDNTSAKSTVCVPRRKPPPDIFEELFGEESVTHESPVVNIDDYLSSDTSQSVLQEASGRPYQRRRTCVQAPATRVYITTPTGANETLKTFAKRKGYSVHVLRTYNPQCDTHKTLPFGTCLLTWEHSNTVSSCFEVLSENHRSLQHNTQLSRLLCDHTSALHRNIQSTCRIANDMEYVPEHARHLFENLSTHQELKLSSTRTFAQLLKQDDNLCINWDKIAKNPHRVPAIFKNKQGSYYRFLFEKHLKNGNVKGVQKSLSTRKKKRNYTRSAGVSKSGVFFQKNSSVPTHNRAKKHCIAICEELVVDKTVGNMYVLNTIYDSRKLYTDDEIDLTTTRNGCIYTQHADDQPVREVGVWTTRDGLLCYTMYDMLPRIVVKTI